MDDLQDKCLYNIVIQTYATMNVRVVYTRYIQVHQTAEN